jgi:uncharacterized membrane protein YgcG
MRKQLLVLVAAAFSLMAAMPAPPPMNGHPVIDAANIIPDDEEAKLDQKLMAIAKTSHHQVAVLTVPDLQGYDIDDYGVNAGRTYGIGSKYSDDGVLITIAPKEHKKRIDVGYGLGGMLTDAQVSQILPEATPSFRAGNYAEGINLMVDDVAKVITPLTPEQLVAQAREKHNREAAAAASWAKFMDFLMTTLGLGAIGAAIFGIYRLVTAPARRRKREEAERQAAADEAERQAEYARMAEERRKVAEEAARREAARIAEQKRKRQAMLDAMTPTQRAAFLDKEQREAAEAAAAAAAAAEAIRRRKRREEEEKEEEERAARRRRDDDDSYSSPSYGGSSSSPSSSSDDSFSGGGGSFGGGGGSDSW